MPLRLGDGWRDGGQAGELPLRAEPPFAESRAYELLLRDLRRYVNEEIAGRSFLIAGHRGAGKTSTVTHAIRKLHNEILEASIDFNKEPRSRRGRLQRPLMVKLVGESLIAPPPELGAAGGRKDEKDEEAKGETKSEAKGAAREEAKGGTGAEACRPAGKQHDRVESALVHMTIALYRALAGEVAEGFAGHAGASSRWGNPTPVFARQSPGLLDNMELAAQLSLELDGTPEPATLRDCWGQIDRLEGGVLWPSQAPTDPDQGMREVVAIATAAQAFQVCSGAITYQVTSQDTASDERKLETSADVKDMVNRLGALGAGAISGAIVGSSATAAAGIGTGLLIWLLGTVALRWTGSRQRKRERSLNYTFLRDRSTQTLDRDLPLVIARIREAGLAPVFVIDELDKLKRQGETVGLIISRLKHLVSDYGFFCFLTDRSYFEEIERKVAKEAYPTEHTFFGERVLIVNRPTDLFTYIATLVEPGPASDGAHTFRTGVFALVAMFRSKLNFIDLSREMDQLTNPDNSITCSDQDLQAPGRFRLEATIQLAINHILMDEEVAGRFESDPSFAQLAVDALYSVARAWQKNSDAVVDVGRATLEKDLLDRMHTRDDEDRPDLPAKKAAAPASPPGGKAQAGKGATAAAAAPAAVVAAVHAGPADEDREEAPRGEISPPDMRELLEMVGKLVEHLEDFDGLKTVIASSGVRIEAAGKVFDSTLLADIVVVEKARLLRPEKPGRRGRFVFELDELARARPGAAAPVVPVAVAAPAKAAKPKRTRGSRKGQQASTGAVPIKSDVDDLLDAVAELLDVTKLTIDDLVSAALLPRNLSDSFVADLRSNLAIAAKGAPDAKVRQRISDGVLTLRKAFIDSAPNLIRGLFLLERVIADVSAQDLPRDVLARVARYFDLRGPDTVLWFGIYAASPPVIDGSPASIRSFAEALQSWRSRLPTGSGLDERRGVARWDHWQREITDFVRQRDARTTRILYIDYALAAANQPPGNLFRAALVDMQQSDWSRAALAALPRPDAQPTAPYWLLFGALTALGFDQRALFRLLESSGPPGLGTPSDADRAAASEMVRNAPTRPSGILHVYADRPGTTAPIEIPESRPMLSVGESQFEAYIPALNWLAEHKLFEEGRDETD